MKLKLIVKTAYANIYREPSFSSELVSQALFFEILNVKSLEGDWIEVSQWDGYRGYTHKFYLSDNFSNQEKNYMILDRCISMYDSIDFKNIITVAPFSSQISATFFGEGDYFVTNPIEGRTFYFKSDIQLSKNNSRSKVLEYSKKLIGSPYLWGGKTPFGYDCSGFVQSVLKAVGIDVKRDTSTQINDSRMHSVDMSSAEAGDLIFFSMEGNEVDHVGIWSGDGSVIHCGGEVKVQSIDDDSHKKLRDSIIAIKSIGELINE